LSKKKTHAEYEEELLLKKIPYKPMEPYVTNKIRILHKCPIETHPPWYVAPNDILRRHGCPVCATNQKKTPTQYIDELAAKGIMYRPVEPYKGAHIKTLHKCLDEDHPPWLVTPNNILKGYGCPSCSKTGFDPTKPGKLYFVSFEDEETFFKIGITNLTAEKRHQMDWKSLKMQLLWEVYFQSGADARAAEKQFLVDNKQFRLNTKTLRSGNTETFSVFIKAPTYVNGVINEFSRTTEGS
jgi:hypothetical protein